MSYTVANLSQNLYSFCDTIKTADLQNIPFVNNNMSEVFKWCENLQTITNINENVDLMTTTFYGCTNLVNAPTLPNSVTSLGGIRDTYWQGHPGSYRFSGAFGACTNLVNAPVIPNTVTSMGGTFMNCTNLVNAPVIPNSVIALRQTFAGCQNLVNFPTIPSSVTNMAWCFSGISNIETKHPTIPTSVVNYTGLFGEQHWDTIPDTAFDLYNTLTTECKQNSSGIFALSTINNCQSSKINTIVNWEELFYGVTTNVDFPSIPSHVTNISGTFAEITNKQLLENIVLPDHIINVTNTFRLCETLVNAPTIPNSVTTMTETFYWCKNLVNAPVIPNSVTNMSMTFSVCANLVNSPVIPDSVIVMLLTFSGCTNLTGDIKIYSNQVNSADYCFSSTTKTKNVYIPFTYSNGVNTITYNSFIKAGYKTDGSVCGVYLKDINLL